MTTAKEFGVWQSEKSYRFKEEALENHAPHVPGMYELVTFDDHQNPRVLYAGWVKDKSIYDALSEHWMGKRSPSAQELLARVPNLYFSFVVDSDAKTPEDQQDLFCAIVEADKPDIIYPPDVKPTGRYAQVTYRDKSLL